MAAINAFETEAVVDPNGSVRVGELPFAVGDRVRVLILRNDDPNKYRHTDEEIARSKRMREDLQGIVIRYDNPEDPACPPEDWDAISGAGPI